MQYLIAAIIIFALLFVVPVVIGIRAGKVKIALPVAILVTGGALLWFGSWAWTRTAEEEVLDSIVSIEGRKLVVSYFGADCEDQRSVAVEEDRRSVRISVTSRSFASGCNDMAVLRTVSISLDEPLGSREVVNVGCTSGRAGCKRVLSPA